MRLVTDLTEAMIKDVLELLYKNEFMNIHMIHFFEHQRDDIGHIYVRYQDNMLVGIMTLRFDGNSNFISFCYEGKDILVDIAKTIDQLKCHKKLLAGSISDISRILSTLSISCNVQPFNNYRFSMSEIEHYKEDSSLELRKVTSLDKSKLIESYLVDFFGAETKEEIEAITTSKKLIDVIRNGIYVLYSKDMPIGMARYLGSSKNYIEITTVYIEPRFRSKGFGKKLIELMVLEALKIKKIPMLQAEVSNESAIKVYESTGFEMVCDYTFIFI